ncbi:MAG: LysR family transcriptional regulator [Pseudomonadota bacterium]
MKRYDPSDMLVFAKVADLLSISGAARALSISKASVSRTITRLEEALSTRLLERSSRHVNITEVGRTFLVYCQRVREEVEAAEAAVGELQASVKGLIRVAVPLVFGRSVVGPALPRFMLAHPDVQMELQVTDRTIDPIEEGFDLVVRIGQQPDSSLLTRELGRAPYAAFASAAYLSQHEPITHPDQIAKHAVIDLFNSAEKKDWVFERNGKQISVPVLPRLDLNEAVIRRDVAIAGVGIALVPSWMCREAVRDGRLVPICPDWTSTRINVISALWPSRRNTLPRLRAFVDFLTEIVPQEFGLERPQAAIKDR